MERVLAGLRSETGGLDCDIFIKQTARVMLTSNIDIADRLINGQLGTVCKVYIIKLGKDQVLFMSNLMIKWRENSVRFSNIKFPLYSLSLIPVHLILSSPSRFFFPFLSD